MKQILTIITGCYECPYCILDPQEEYWRKWTCEQLELEVPKDGIHPDCPLDDVVRV